LRREDDNIKYLKNNDLINIISNINCNNFNICENNSNLILSNDNDFVNYEEEHLQDQKLSEECAKKYLNKLIKIYIEKPEDYILGKSIQYSPEDNINIKIKFLDYYIENQDIVDYYDVFCHNDKYSNYCKICFKEFTREDIIMECYNCCFNFHNVIN